MPQPKQPTAQQALDYLFNMAQDRIAANGREWNDINAAFHIVAEEIAPDNVVPMPIDSTPKQDEIEQSNH